MSARRQAGLTQRDLATRLNVSSGAVGQWETGGVPSTERLVALACVLGVSVDWLLGIPLQAEVPVNGLGGVDANRRLVDEAHQLGVDLHAIVAEARQRRWIEENREALSDANKFLTRHGLWSDGKRQF